MYEVGSKVISKLLLQRWQATRRCYGGAVGCLEVAVSVFAVAKGLVGRGATAAQADVRLASGNRPGGSGRIDNGDGAFNEQGTVIANLDGNVGHGDDSFWN